MNLADYRATLSERQRTADLLRLMPSAGHAALDVGARDGHFSRLMADRYAEVTAVDLVAPVIDHPRITCVVANAAKLPFNDRKFDLVFCAEVLEHVPTRSLAQVCRELVRVSSGCILLGVPFRQDIRVGRTTCGSCGKRNPPWGHVNSFDLRAIEMLFPRCDLQEVSFVGESAERTNWLSTILMDYAGNPYGTYQQDEPCIFCGNRLSWSGRRTVGQRLATKSATVLQRITQAMTRTHGNWVHVLLRPK